jgi:hypothetical protein
MEKQCSKMLKTKEFFLPDWMHCHDGSIPYKVCDLGQVIPMGILNNFINLRLSK